jgi:uncharacterized protein (DUF2062 family)
MLRRFFRRVMPNIDKVREVRALSVFGDRLFHPALWHVHRRSAAGGVAVGMFCGLIPGPLQMLGAGVVCLFLRVNLPIALITTFYTNPLTIVPLYLLAYELGAFVLGSAANHHALPPPDWDWAELLRSAQTLGHWMLSLGPPLALGVFLLACILAALGYVLVRTIWSIYLRRAWRARRQRRGVSRSTR